MFPDEPTHFPENGATPTTIDFGINKNVTNVSDVQSLNELSSDHNPIVFTLYSQTKSENPLRIYDYENTDWDKFRQMARDEVKITPNIRAVSELEIEVQRYTNTIKKCIEQTVPIKCVKQIQDNLPQYIIELIKDRNKIRRLWQRTRNVEHKKLMKKHSNGIRSAIINHRNETWRKKLEKLNVNDNSLWRMTKLFKNEFKLVPTIVKSGEEAITDIEKANMLASQFEEVHNLNINNNTNEQNSIINQLQQYINEASNEDWLKYITSPAEVKEIIKTLPSRKAPGMDKIQNIIFKNLGRKPIVQLMYIINATIKLAHFPRHWKTGKIIPILKVGKNSVEPSSYRPISLLSTMSKITEKVIMKRKD